ncbi:MAG: hypothetical protein ACOC2L_03810, partial [Candidatus Sumerlaeota bacterium]
MIAYSKQSTRQCFAVLLVLAVLLSIAAAQPSAEWQDDDYQHRYKVVFPPLKNADWAEVGV